MQECGSHGGLNAKLSVILRYIDQANSERMRGPWSGRGTLFLTPVSQDCNELRKHSKFWVGCPRDERGLIEHGAALVFRLSCNQNVIFTCLAVEPA